MKRILAMTLALLFAFTSAALAENAITYEFSVSVDEAAAQQVLSPVLETLLQGDNSISVTNLISAFSRLMDGLGVRVTADLRDTFPFRCVMDVLFKNQSLLDLSVETTETEVLMTSTLIPDHALSVPLESANEATAVSDQELMRAAGAAALSLLDPTTAFVGGLNASETRGAFSGDAYEGGTSCITIELNDAAIADYLDSLMTDEVRELVTLFAEVMEINADRIFNAWANMNEEVRTANAYNYLIRLVQDDEHSLIGASLTVFRGSAQTATLSIGFDGQSVKIVFGSLYSTEANYWCEADVALDSTGDAMTVTCTAREYLGSTEMSYAAVRAHPLMKLPETSLSVNLTCADAGMNWQAVCKWTDAEKTLLPFDSVAITSTGSAGLNNGIPDGNVTIDLLLNDIRTMGMTASLTESDPLPGMQQGLTVCDMTSRSNEQLELQDEILTKLTNKLTVRMIKLLPLDVMMTIPNLINIP